jgi:hypothetical protein
MWQMASPKVNSGPSHRVSQAPQQCQLLCHGSHRSRLQPCQPGSGRGLRRTTSWNFISLRVAGAEVDQLKQRRNSGPRTPSGFMIPLMFSYWLLLLLLFRGTRKNPTTGDSPDQSSKLGGQRCGFHFVFHCSNSRSFAFKSLRKVLLRVLAVLAHHNSDAIVPRGCPLRVRHRAEQKTP